MKSKISFWQLLNEYTVVIPMIQRDYAQGRLDARTVQIRESFIDAIETALSGNESAINLDFVYGSDHSGCLVLLDGQQRLTTLFLLHWLLASLCPKVAPVAAARLQKFTYETRTSTRDFCKELTTLLCDGRAIWNDGEKVSAFIEDAPWFPRSWKQDPSVASMLQMLDALQNRFAKQNSEVLWNFLTRESNPAITFQFLNMKEFRLTDELYVKMNARGRALSDFENFKAWLQVYVERKHFALAPTDWTEAIDGRWTDMFWRSRESGVEEIDEAYLYFFNGQALCAFAATREIAKGKLDECDFLDIQSLNDNEYLGAEKREALGAYTADALDRCFAVMDALSDPSDDLVKMIKKYLPWFTGPKNYAERVLAHAITVFLSKVSGIGVAPALLDIEFTHWMRVAENLTRNTYIDSPLSFVRAVKSIEVIATKVLPTVRTGRPLYQVVADMSPSEIDFFAEPQREEEVRKCKLIDKDAAWDGALIEAEIHPYFSGQVGFLIDFSSSTSGTEDPVDFKRYLPLVSLLFTDSICGHNEYLLQRALLSFGDYTFTLGSNHNLCIAAAGTLRDREENWRRVFRNAERRDLLKKLCDNLFQRLEGDDLTANAIVTHLRAIIAGKTFLQPRSTEDWRRMLVKGNSLLDECRYLQIRRTELPPGSGYITTYLLGGLRMSGSHAELSTYDLFLHLLRDNCMLLPFTVAEYHWVSGSAEEPYAYLDGWHFSGCNVLMKILNQVGQFEICLLEKEGQVLPDTIRQKLETDLAFSAANSSGALVRIVPMDNISQLLGEIISTLGKLVDAAPAPGNSPEYDNAMVAATHEDPEQ